LPLYLNNRAIGPMAFSSCLTACSSMSTTTPETPNCAHGWEESMKANSGAGPPSVFRP
jgi:hypothetical protein